MVLADDTTTVAIVSAIPATIAAAASLAAVLIGRRNVEQAQRNHGKLVDIDTAVNGAAEGDDSIRQNVQTLVRRSRKENGRDGVSGP